MKTLLWILGAAWLGLAACSRPEAVSTPKPPAVSVAARAQRPVPVYGQDGGQTEAVKTGEVRRRVEGFIDRQGGPPARAPPGGRPPCCCRPRAPLARHCS